MLVFRLVSLLDTLETCLRDLDWCLEVRSFPFEGVKFNYPPASKSILQLPKKEKTSHPNNPE